MKRDPLPDYRTLHGLRPVSCLGFGDGSGAPKEEGRLFPRGKAALDRFKEELAHDFAPSAACGGLGGTRIVWGPGMIVIRGQEIG